VTRRVSLSRLPTGFAKEPHERVAADADDNLRTDPPHASPFGFSDDMEHWASGSQAITYDDECRVVAVVVHEDAALPVGPRRGASRGQIASAVLRWRDLAEGDAFVETRSARRKMLWEKQMGVAEPDSAQHSFMLLCATPVLGRRRHGRTASKEVREAC